VIFFYIKKGKEKRYIETNCFLAVTIRR